MHAVHMSAAPYRLANFRGHARGWFQNKPPNGVLRGVGQPIACTVTEQLVDLAARKLGIDPAEFRLRNYAPEEETAQHRRHRAGRAVARALPPPALQLMRYDGPAPAAGGSCARTASVAASGSPCSSSRPRVGPALYGGLGVRVAAHEACRLSARARWPCTLRHQRHRPGAGHEQCAPADRRRRDRRRSRHGRDRHRRHRGDAIRRRRLGLARHGARRRGGAARRPPAAAEHAGDRRRPAAAGARGAAPRTPARSSTPPAWRSSPSPISPRRSPTAPTRSRSIRCRRSTSSRATRRAPRPI